MSAVCFCVCSAPACTMFSGEEAQEKRRIQEGQDGQENYTQDDLHGDLLNYTGQFEAVVRSTSSEISSRAENREIRRRALLWKVNLVPLVHEVATQEDEQEAYLALALLTEMQKQYLTTGTGQDVFGPHQQLAVDAANELEDNILRIGTNFLPEARTKKLRKEVREYAKEHEIRGKNFSVESFQSFVQKVKKQRDIFTSIVNVPLSPFSALQGVGNTPAAVHGVKRAVQDMTAVAEGLPQVVRWQTELLMYDIENRDTVEQTLAQMKKFNQTAAKLEKSVRSWPSDVTEIVDKTSPEIENLNKLVEKTNRLMGETQSLVQQINRTGKEWKPLLEKADQEQTSAERPPEEEGASLKDYRNTIQEADQTVQNLQKLAADLKALIESEGIDSTSNSLSSLGKQAETSSEKVINLAFVRGLQLLLALFVGLLIYRTVVYMLFEPASENAS